MKPWPVISVIALLSAAIGWKRQGTLEDLRRDNARLERSTSNDPKFRASDRSEPRTGLSAEQEEEIRSLLGQLLAFQQQPGETNFHEIRQVSELLVDRFANIDHSLALKLAGDPPQEEISALVARVLSQANPREALLLLEKLPAYGKRDMDLRFAFLRAAPLDPSLIVRQFESYDDAGSPVVLDKEVLKTFFAAQARIEPEIAVSRLLSPKGTSMLQDINLLPQQICDELRNPEEHRAFLTALRMEGLKFPGSPRLEQLRSGYVGHLQQQLGAWPYDDAFPLVKNEFTEKETRSFVHRVISSHVPEEPERWAQWVSELPWDDKLNHPIGNFIRRWEYLDAAGARKWLETTPENAIRNEAIKNYALNRSSRAPADAADVAAMLPPGKERERVINIITRSAGRK